MLKMTCWSGIVALVVAAASGKDFPLQFKTLKIDDAMEFPGGYGASGTLRLMKPGELKKEPKPLSKHPLYGHMESGEKNGFLFRLDESRGDGKGYDQLIIDLNDNGDLTDDAVVKKYTSFWGSRKTTSNRVRFGPIEVPADKRIGAWRPIYYAEAYVYRRDLSNASENDYLGSLRMRPGWYLETTVDVSGAKQKFGICDSDGNLKLGEPWKASTYFSGEEFWYFQPGDSFLMDTDGSGKFENNPFNSESTSFGPIVYFGNKAYKVTLAGDSKSIRVEPWTESLAEVALQPQGEQVRDVTLAWERPAGKWQLIKPAMVNGKVSVPPGNYRLYTCVLAPETSVREQVMASGYKRTTSKAMAFEAGKANTLRCGAPLEVKVTAEWSRAPQVVYEKDAKGKQVARVVTPTNDLLRINGVVMGSGGEIYSSYGKGRDYKADPPKPTFKILNAQGKELASGNLEFG